MDSNRIEVLLKKYWSCETSLEEEKQLRDYFQGNDIPNEWKETASLFKYFEAQKNASLPDAALEDVVKHNLPKGKTRNLFYNSMRIAAGIAVLVVAGWFVHNEVKPDRATTDVDTYKDPKLAFEETKKALLMISSSFGKAEEQAKKINLFNEAQQEIKKENASSAAKNKF